MIKRVKAKCAKKKEEAKQEASKIDKVGEDSTQEIFNSTLGGVKQPNSNLGKIGNRADEAALAGLSGVKLKRDLGDGKNRVRAMTDKSNLPKNKDAKSKVKAQNKVKEPLEQGSAQGKSKNSKSSVRNQSNDSVMDNLQSQGNRSVSTTTRNKALKTVGPHTAPRGPRTNLRKVL